MEIPVTSWLEAIWIRHSRRSYDGRPLAPMALEGLEALCAGFRPYADARTVLLRQAPPDIFSGILGAYGRVGGAPSALVFVGVEGTAGLDEHVGYTGEAAVLEATRLGLGTCWIAGTFSARRTAALVALAEGERILAISPLGYASAEPSFAERTLFQATKPKRRRPLAEIAPESAQGSWPAWALAGLRAAQVAPSAINRQPWRFRLEQGTVIVSFAGMSGPGISKRLDCGIAMLHFELGARDAGATGTWEALTGQDVARWRPA